MSVRRALGGSGLGSLSSEDLSSISACHSNIDNIEPPSMLEDLDMENSMIRVASISSEVAAQVAGSGNYDDVSLLTSEAIREIVEPAVRAVETFDLPSLVVDNNSVSRQLESVSAPTMMEDLTLTQGTVTLKPAPNAPTYILHDEADTIIGVTDADADIPDLPRDTKGNTPAQSEGESSLTFTKSNKNDDNTLPGQKSVAMTSLSNLQEIMCAIDTIKSKFETLNTINKQAVLIHLQECIEFLQLGSEDFPQLDGNSDLVIFCDFCNHEFLGSKRFRDRQTHYINKHLKSKFEENTPSKYDGYFKCNEAGCQYRTTRKLDFWLHKGGKHGFIDQLIKEHFIQNPPLIPANGTINLDSSGDHKCGMVTEKSLTDSKDKGMESSSSSRSGSYDNIPASCSNINMVNSSATTPQEPGPQV